MHGCAPLKGLVIKKKFLLVFSVLLCPGVCGGCYWSSEEGCLPGERGTEDSVESCSLSKRQT